MWKTLVGKFQPLPATATEAQNDLERNWDERDTTGIAVAAPESSLMEHSRLRDAFFRCMESGEDQQRAQQFQKALALFASIFGRQVSGHLVAESIHDIKAFTAMACAQLERALDSVKVKSLPRRIASLEYMKVLRNSETFAALKAIDILSKAPDTLLESFVDHHTHSGLLDIFLNMAEFPSPEFDDSLPQSVPSILVISTLTNALKRMLWRKPIITSLIETDHLFGLFEALVLPRNNLGDPAELYIWKARVMDVTDFVIETTETDIMVYLQSKECAKLLSNSLLDYLVDGSIDSVHREEGILILRIIVKLIKKSSLMSSVLLQDFKGNKIYETLSMLLVSPPFDEDMLTFKYTIISLVEELVFIDKEALPTPEEGTPYQHSDFSLPAVGPEHAGAVVRNLEACQVLVTALLYPDISSMTLLPAGDKDKNLPPDQFSLTVFATLLSIIRDHPMNYFLLERLNILSYAIERLDSYHSELQSSVMELFTFVLKDLNYVPFRDLVILSIHFQGLSSTTTTALVCSTVAELLQTIPRFKDVLREIGLIDMFCHMLEELSLILQETFGNPNFNHRMSVIDFGKAFAAKGAASKGSSSRKYGIEVVHHFNGIMECLVGMLRDSRSNISLFQKTFRGDLFSLLHYNETRDGILRVIIALIVEGYRFTMEDRASTAQPKSPQSVRSPETPKFMTAPYQLGQLCEILQSLNRYDFKMKLAILGSLSEIFTQSPDLKDVFREGGGYVSIVSLLIRLEDAYGSIEKFETETTSNMKRKQRRDLKTDERVPTKEDMIQLFGKVFSVLSESMRDHEGNVHYFEEHIGFASIADALQLTGVFKPHGDAASMFGILFAFAVQSESVARIFQDAEEVRETPEMVARWLNSPKMSIQNPQAVLGIWRIALDLKEADDLVYCVMMSLFALSCANRRNQVLMGQTGLLDELLKVLFEDREGQPSGTQGFILNSSPDGKEERNTLEVMSRLSKRLIEMGMSSFGFRYLMEKFSATNELSFGECSGLVDMLLHGVTHSRWPSFVQFDGYNRLELRSLGKHAFPPLNGYTFLVWLCVESFDDELPVQILEISDEDQRCYLTVQIETATQRLVVGISHQHSVSFDFVFEVGRWYHLALVHNKPKISNPSGSLSIYIDGILGEKVKCGYLSSPNGEVRTYIGRHQKQKTVRRDGLNLSWNLGPCYLIDEPLDVQIMDVLYNLSPRYHGNFQDSFGKFQTYETSTALNINLEAARRRSAASPRKQEEQVALMNAIRGSSGNCIPEEKIVFAFSGRNLLDTGDAKTIINLANVKNEQFCRILFNSAIPRINRGINPLSAIGILVGAPLVAVPRGLDDSIWKVGGCVVALRIIENAQDTVMLEKAVLLLGELIRCSWRNSEDMERIYGYEILGYILKQKKALFSVEMMNTLLSVVGMDLEYPEESVVTNPFAFRHLMLDLEIWRKSDVEIQLLHLEQFKVFLQHSHKAPLNVKRLSTMHVVKKMLAPLRTGNYPIHQLPHYIDAMKAVVFNHFSTETVRNLATFLVSTLKPSTLQRSLSTNFGQSEDQGECQSRRMDIVFDPKAIVLSPTMRHAVMGNVVMEMLEQILCDKHNSAYVHKFAYTITNKWTLLFLENASNPYGAVLVMRILSRLFYTQGSAYVAKFRASDGFLVLQSFLPQFWNIAPMIHVVISILLGIDICDVPLQSPLDPRTLNTLYKNAKDPNRIICPDILPALMIMLRNGVAASSTPMTSVEKAASEADLSKATVNKVEQTYMSLIEFFTDMQDSTRMFKDICSRADFIEELATILFPFICNLSKAIPVEQELDSRDVEVQHSSTLEMAGQDVLAGRVNGQESNSSILSLTAESTTLGTPDMVAIPTSNSQRNVTSPAPLTPLSALHSSAGISQTTAEGIFRRTGSSASIGRIRDVDLKSVKEPIALALVGLLVVIGIDSILDSSSRSLSAIDILLQACPPAYKDHQVHFQSFLLGHIVIGLEHTILSQPELLGDSRVMTNLNQFSELIVDLACQGWFIGSYLIQVDLLANVIEIIFTQDARPDSVKTLMTSHLYRLVCFYLSQCHGLNGELINSKVIMLVEKCIYFQKVLLSPSAGDNEFLKSLLLQLFTFLPESDAKARSCILTLIKLVFLMKPVEASALLRLKPNNPSDEEDGADDGYTALVEGNYDEVMRWRTENATELDPIFSEFRKSWEAMMSLETRVSEDSQRQQYNRRTQKLKRLFRRQHLERNILQQYRSKTHSWTRSIRDMEELRYSKSIQDLDEHARFVKNEWNGLLREVCRKGAIWGSKESPSAQAPVRWRLDFTEARSRMRRKMRVDERVTDEPYLPKQSGSAAEAKVSSLGIPKNGKPAIQAPVIKSLAENLKDADVASLAASERNHDSKSDKESIAGGGGSLQTDESTKQDTNEGDSTDQDTQRDSEDETSPSHVQSTHSTSEEVEIEMEPALEEAANRKILRLLEAGDVVFEVYNMSRVTGLEAVEGLLLICKLNMYLIDNYFQRLDGEVVDISEVADSERDQYLQLLASNDPNSSTSIGSSEARHQCRKWRFEDIKEVHRRRYLLRNVALELFFVDGRNYLINLNLQQRDLVYNRLATRVSSLTNNSLQTGDRSAMIEASNNTPQPSTLGSKLANIFAASSISELTSKWERREISNFQYLMHLNTMAGRTYNDLTQYPVFPWILADYESEELDLTNPRTFRDLSRPMGAQTPDREKEFNDRYHTWDGGDEQNPPFHYGTHYSSAMIVCSYLIRMEPFTHEYLKLQGGQFDHADRLFHSIGKSWTSASQKTMSDVRELIPEFFYLPEFLMNANEFNFGTLQTTGEKIDHVSLPPWAKDDPKVFIERHREALECEYVSAHLHEWIDLIFGYKQVGPDAVRAVNVFHHMSYEGSIDLDTIEDHVQKSATIGIIHNFGQTPRQIFKKPHGPRLPPNRDPLSANFYNLSDHAEFLTQSVMPMKDIGLPVGEILFHNEKSFVGHSQRTYEPYTCAKFVEWGFSDNSVRLYSSETGKVLGIFENLHLEAITCVKWADDRTIVTTSRDTVVCTWRIVLGKSYELKLMKCLRGHREAVTTVAVSVAYSIIVSGSEDKTCIVWDLNRLEYVRQLGKHEDGVRVVAINDATGDIATCSGPVLRLWTVNGDLILQKYTNQIGDPILDCVFYAGRTGEWISRQILYTSHRRGIVKVWDKEIVDQPSGRASMTISHSSISQALMSPSRDHNNGHFQLAESGLAKDDGSPPMPSSPVGPGSSRSRQISQAISKPMGSRWALRLVQTYTYEDRLRTDNGVIPNIVSLHVSSSRRALYTGDSLGRVHAWVLPDGSRNLHWMQAGRDSICVSCTTRFPLLERRFNCKTCGGVFCGTCTMTPTAGIMDKQARFCFKCASGKLKELMN